MANDRGFDRALGYGLICTTPAHTHQGNHHD